MRERKSVNRVLVRKPEGKNYLKDTGVEGRKINRSLGSGIRRHRLDRAGSG
jgi:hypothetical protein